MLKGFKNFLMRGDVIVVAVGLVVALAFSNLVKAFTDNIINPLIAAVQPGNMGPGLGWQLINGGGEGTFLNLGGFISAIVDRARRSLATRPRPRPAQRAYPTT
jgi:large conductance mechanosensitive channel